jgi:8-oxo-dGTP diphosphatase
MKAIDVAAGLVFNAGKLLITQRREDDHLGGYWEFPGGKRETQESFEACLQRELREELDIHVEVLEAVADITHAYPTKTVHLRFFRCAMRTGQPRNIGCQNFAWVTAPELKLYQFPPADEQLLDTLMNHPEWWDAET